MVTHIRSMEVDGYKRNFKDFYENFTYLKFINRRRPTIPIGIHASLLENYPLSSLLLMEMSVQDEIQLSNNRVDTPRGWTLEHLLELL